MVVARRTPSTRVLFIFSDNYCTRRKTGYGGQRPRVSGSVSRTDEGQRPEAAEGATGKHRPHRLHNSICAAVSGRTYVGLLKAEI